MWDLVNRLRRAEPPATTASAEHLARLAQALSEERRRRRAKRQRRLLWAALTLLGMALLATYQPPAAPSDGSAAAVGGSTAPTRPVVPQASPSPPSARPGALTPLVTLPSTASDPCDFPTNFKITDCFIEILTDALFGGFYKFVKQEALTTESWTFLFGTPGPLTYQQPIVTFFFSITRGLLDGILALVIVFAGYQYLWGSYYSFREFVGSFAIWAIIANSADQLLTQFIVLEDALSTTAVTGVFQLPLFQDLARNLGLKNIFDVFFNLGNLVGFFYLFAIIELLMLLALAVQMMVRIALLDVLFVLAPLGLMCFALPQTQRWGRLWAEAFTSTLIVQFIQMVMVALGAGLIATVDLGASGLSIFAGIGVLYLTFKAPGWLLSGAARVLGGGGGNRGQAAQAAMRVAAVAAA